MYMADEGWYARARVKQVKRVLSGHLENEKVLWGKNG